VACRFVCPGICSFSNARDLPQALLAIPQLVACAVGSWILELYALIEFDSNTVYKKARQHKHLRAKKQTGQSLKQNVTVSDVDKLGPSQVCLQLFPILKPLF